MHDKCHVLTSKKKKKKKLGQRFKVLFARSSSA